MQHKLTKQDVFETKKKDDDTDKNDAISFSHMDFVVDTIRVKLPYMLSDDPIGYIKRTLDVAYEVYIYIYKKFNGKYKKIKYREEPEFKCFYVVDKNGFPFCSIFLYCNDRDVEFYFKKEIELLCGFVLEDDDDFNF